MARYHSKYHLNRKNRNWIYSILALTTIAIIIIAIYNPFSKNKEDETVPSTTQEALEEKPSVLPEPPVPMPAAEETTVKAEPPQMPEMTDVEPNAQQPPSAVAVAEQPKSKTDELIEEAMALIKENPAKIIEARNILNEALPMPMGEQKRAFVKKQLSNLADMWLFSKTIFPKDTLCSSYKVNNGEILSGIGERHKVPWEILSGLNNTEPEKLQAGQTIKVINGPFHARIYRSTFTLDLYLQNTFVRSFRVGLGRPGYETPTGLWIVKPGGKLEHPNWTDPDTGRTYHYEDPDYPLGSRWIGLKGLSGAAKDRTGFAIHGTNDPAQIGTQGSRGCIRMYNGDAVLMYNILMPGFSQVEVVE